ncbi:hypothetical protein FRB96_006260 [Tulasnella sp. 330]|nr:hypothetical protein FRB96_006260 [Tulasnella sp. 330]KAG8890580.1 hypothetical protein FRB98_007134 [Tulasnella sp. 332]
MANPNPNNPTPQNLNPYVSHPGFPYYPYYNPQQQLYYPYVYPQYYSPYAVAGPAPLPPPAPIDPNLLTGPAPQQPVIASTSVKAPTPAVPKSPTASLEDDEEDEEDGQPERFALHPVSYPAQNPMKQEHGDEGMDETGAEVDKEDGEYQHAGPPGKRTRTRKPKGTASSGPLPSNIVHVTGAPKQDDLGAVTAAEVAKFASPVRNLPHIDLDIFPSRGVFENILYTYQSNLSARKRNKALISRSAYAEIQATLVEIKESRCRRGTAQFRFWVKKMFGLINFYGHEIVGHQGKPVAIREDIYDILVHCHDQCEHGGRDRTVEVVKDFYRWIPKVIIGEFVKHCPGCSVKRATVKSETSKMPLYDLGDIDRMEQMESMEQDDEEMNFEGGTANGYQNADGGMDDDDDAIE